MTKLFVVVPCYNEEEVLPQSSKILKKKLEQLIGDKKISPESRILLVDDGSKDKTWKIISELYENDPIFSGVKLSRNRGHQNALLCGLMTAKEYADVTISIDADLQDDINAFDEMLEKFEDGCDIVYGVRSKRETDTIFKRTTAEGFYKVMEALGAKIVFNHADYRLMSKRALNDLAEYEEVNLFLRGIVPMLGYKTDIVTYERSERLAGESKYPLKKMLALAWEGITSMSTSPIKMVTRAGIVLFFISIIMLIYFLIRYFMGATIAGWASLAVSLWAIGGLQLLAIGIIGEYIGKIYLETKKRPRFKVEKLLLK